MIFFEVSGRVCLVCRHTFWGAKGLFGSICLPQPARYLGEPPWYFDDIGENLLKPLRQNFLVVENEFGGALHTPKFFWKQ